MSREPGSGDAVRSTGRAQTSCGSAALGGGTNKPLGSSVGQHEEPFNRVPPRYLEAFLRLCATCCRVAGFF